MREYFLAPIPYAISCKACTTEVPGQVHTQGQPGIRVPMSPMILKGLQKRNFWQYPNYLASTSIRIIHAPPGRTELLVWKREITRMLLRTMSAWSILYHILNTQRQMSNLSYIPKEVLAP